MPTHEQDRRRRRGTRRSRRSRPGPRRYSWPSILGLDGARLPSSPPSTSSPRAISVNFVGDADRAASRAVRRCDSGCAMTIRSSASKSKASRHGVQPSRWPAMSRRFSSVELTVEVGVDLGQRRLAVDGLVLVIVMCVFGHGSVVVCGRAGVGRLAVDGLGGPAPPGSGAGRRALVRGRTRTTASGAPFFPGAAGSSPCRSGCRGSRRSPCRRTPRRRRAARPCGTARAGASMASFTSASVKQSISSSSALRPALAGLEATEAAVEVEVLDLVELGLVGPALLGPVDVDEGVGEDPVQPGLEVGALLEAAERPGRP